MPYLISLKHSDKHWIVRYWLCFSSHSALCPHNTKIKTFLSNVNPIHCFKCGFKLVHIELEVLIWAMLSQCLDMVRSRKRRLGEKLQTTSCHIYYMPIDATIVLWQAFMLRYKGHPSLCSILLIENVYIWNN